MNKFSYFLLALMTAGCVEENLEGAGDCPGNQACTEIFLSIPITILDSKGAPVSLDEYYTVRQDTGEKINLQKAETDSIWKANGRYPILDDNFVQKVLFGGSEFEFVGKKSGKVVVQESYKIGHDCCHIKLVSGNDRVTVD